MEAEKFLNLYDSFWFKLQILNKQRFPSNHNEDSVSSLSETQDPQTTPKKPDSPQTQFQIHHNRSMSDQLSSTTSLESAFSMTSSSPQKLCTILSGKETQSLHRTEPPKKTIKEKKNNNNNRTRAKRSEAKSLSDLEFEELKGFMDLGFVFSEKDRDSSLAEIIPGLHRLGMENKEEEEEEEEEKEKEKKEEDKENERGFVADENEGALISRPYLSEAWNVFDFRPKREYHNSLMNWRFPALSNEIDMKDNLKWWAHTVASTVR